MSIAIIRKIPVFVVPTAVLIATWFVYPYMALLPPTRLELALLSPYLITLLGMFVSVHFHRARPFMALLVLGLFFWCSRSFLAAVPVEPALSPLFQGFVLLVPPNLLLFAMMRERGLFSVVGRCRFIFLALQVGAAYWLFSRHFYEMLPFIARSYSGLQFLSGLFVPQTAILSGAVCFVAIALLALRRQSPVDSGMLGALAAFFIACNWLADRDIHSAFCASGALIITLSVLRDSYNMAFRDDLTGIPSRRSLNESLHGLGRRYTIAMLDVDHFKRFNDTYGHDVGDQVLKMVARKMMGVGGGGKAFRYGGEEFTILFSGRQAADALPYLEELRIAIADYRLALRNSDRPKDKRKGKGQRGSRAEQGEGAYASVTVSIGVAESGGELKNTAEVMKAADKALYRAKSGGRNQVRR